jgi:hypothetical protein
MPIFGPPNVEKMEANRDIKGLIKALGYKKDPNVRKAATLALVKIGKAAKGSDSDFFSLLDKAMGSKDENFVQAVEQVYRGLYPEFYKATEGKPESRLMKERREKEQKRP